MPFVPSKYNLAIFDAIKNSNCHLLIGATAGSGKTTTLIESLKFIPKTKDIIFLAFNKDIVEELKNRVPPYVQCRTLHSFGASILHRYFPTHHFDEHKSFKICLKLYKTWGIKEKSYSYCYRISKIVDLMCLTLKFDDNNLESLAEQYDIDTFGNELAHAKEAFTHFYKKTDTFNFTDMLFQLAIRDFKLPKYDYVLVDEVQDLSNAAAEIVRKIVKPGRGRMIAVGDINQSIYGFAGASYESYHGFKSMFPNTVEFPLSISYRCSKAVVRHCQKSVPLMEYAPEAIEGEDRVGTLEELQPGDWVICRNLRPLIIVFKWLLQNHRKAHIKGREIGENLVNLIDKVNKPNIPLALKAMAELLLQLKEKLYRVGCPRPEEADKYIQLKEKISIIQMLWHGQTPEKFKEYIRSLFVDNPDQHILLSTIHRVKGLENRRVFHILPNLIPSSHATTAEQLQQEQNLYFVATSRAKESIILVPRYDETLAELIEEER